MLFDFQYIIQFYCIPELYQIIAHFSWDSKFFKSFFNFSFDLQLYFENLLIVLKSVIVIELPISSGIYNFDFT